MRFGDRTRVPGERQGRVTALHGAALYLGAVLGTGVVALPGMTARAAGPASLIAWLGLVVLSVPLAATFAGLAARYPDAGGVATYVRRAFGAGAAAVTGWWFYAILPVGMPAAALIAGYYVADAFGGGRTVAVVTGAALILAVIMANAAGLRVSAAAQLLTAGGLVALLSGVIVLSAPHGTLDALHPFAPHGWWAVGSAAAMLLWAFAGWEAVTHLAAEFRYPGRDIKRATATALIVVSVLYLAVASTVILVLGQDAGATNASLARLLDVTIGGYAPQVAAVIAVALTFGTMNAYVAGGAKLGAALGRDGALPGWLAAGSAVGEVPRRSLAMLLAVGGACYLVVVFSGAAIEPLVLASSASFAAVYAVGAAAATRLLPRHRLVHSAAYVSAALAVLLLAATGRYVVFPLAIAAASVGYQWVRASHQARTIERPP